MAEQTLAGKAILVVEGDEVTREGFVTVLRREGYATVSVANGQEGLNRLRAGLRPGLILLDMMSPPLDGWRFLKQCQQDPALAAVPVVIVTGLGVATLEWAVSLGACGYLRKPIEVAEL